MTSLIQTAGHKMTALTNFVTILSQLSNVDFLNNRNEKTSLFLTTVLLFFRFFFFNASILSAGPVMLLWFRSPLAAEKHHGEELRVCVCVV